MEATTEQALKEAYRHRGLVSPEIKTEYEDATPDEEEGPESFEAWVGRWAQAQLEAATPRERLACYLEAKGMADDLDIIWEIAIGA
jgi:hypothetical protein